MDYILETHNLTKTYDKVDAAKDINLHIKEGQIYGLIGRNGAGKTTIMRMISGLSNPTSGSYSLFGKTGDELRSQLRQVGVLIENPGLYTTLSGYENIKIKAIGMGVYKPGYPEELLERVGLEKTDKKKSCGSYSLGMRQRLGIALALVGEPRLLVLDEPINGLDPQGIFEVRTTLERLRDENKVTIMISSHILSELSMLANAYGIIHAGRLIDEFTNDDLAERTASYVTIRCSDNDAAMSALKGIGINDVVEKDHNLRVSEQLDNSAAMARAIINAGVELSEIFVQGLTLEDYYLQMTGGEHNG